LLTLLLAFERAGAGRWLDPKEIALHGLNCSKEYCRAVQASLESSGGDGDAVCAVFYVRLSGGSE
jgi:hypothetical protein